MYRRLLLLSGLLFISRLAPSAAAQEMIKQPLVAKDRGAAKIYPLPGSHLLWQDEQEVRAYLTQHPDMMAQMKLRKSAAWNFQVGNTKSWYAVDFTTSQLYLTASTCRAVGVNCYIFVENALWGNRVTQAAVDSVRAAFDLRTPANNAKGVYQMDVEAFGTPPDVDNDAKIIILILDIRDGFSGSGGFVQGYFSPRNETNLSQSNQAEIYFIDANPTNLNDATPDNPTGLAGAMSTSAHEFQHMIHWKYDLNELTFINEGCSLAAEVISGYPIYPQSGYVNETNHYLLDFRQSTDPEVDNDYSRAARFMVYIRDQAGIGVFKPIVASSAHGIAGLDAGLQAFGSLLRFNNIFPNWAIANVLDDRTVNTAYGYIYPNLPKAVAILHGSPNVPLTSSSVQPLGAEYQTFKYGTNLRVQFTVENPSLLIKAVETGPSTKRVLEVTPNVDFFEPEYGSTYTEIDFVVMNTSTTSSYNYSYHATGADVPVEVKWDTTEPAGYLSLSPLDTVCVTFDALPGGRLDSIRVALRRQGAITGGIWQFTGNLQPSPLGKRLAYPITASTTLTPPVINPGSETPYPMPYPNWRKVDLGAYNISTDQPFAAAFVIRVPDTPAVMITRYPGQSPYHSFTYLNAPGGTQAPGWFYLSADASNIWIYLIRAYVSFSTTTGVRQTAELEPASFVLAQNYPNPFNPSTTIEFLLPQASFVTLKVYNALGEEVSTLVSGKREAGKYSVVWDASGLPSGVYFYRLQSEGFVETKKLVLMK